MKTARCSDCQIYLQLKEKASKREDCPLYKPTPDATKSTTGHIKTQKGTSSRKK